MKLSIFLFAMVLFPALMFGVEKTEKDNNESPRTYFGGLPEEIVLEIINMIIDSSDDFKTRMKNIMTLRRLNKNFFRLVINKKGSLLAIAQQFIKEKIHSSAKKEETISNDMYPVLLGNNLDETALSVKVVLQYDVAIWMAHYLDNSGLVYKSEFVTESLAKTAEYNASDTARLLIKNDAKVDKMAGRITPLMKAAIHGSVDAARVLLNNGANINLQGAYGMTALHWAAMHNKEDVMKLLLQYRANVYIQDHEGRTVLGYALESGERGLKVAEFLLKHGTTVRGNYIPNPKACQLLQKYNAYPTTSSTAESGCVIV